MRVVKDMQLQLGQTKIADIKFDPKSRDELPKLLRGLQYLYITDSIREEVFALLEKHISPNVSKNNGRPGMDLWKILVLGAIRYSDPRNLDHWFGKI